MKRMPSPASRRSARRPMSAPRRHSLLRTNAESFRGICECGSAKQSGFLPCQGYFVALLFCVNIICSHGDYNLSHLDRLEHCRSAAARKYVLDAPASARLRIYQHPLPRLYAPKGFKIGTMPTSGKDHCREHGQADTDRDSHQQANFDDYGFSVTEHRKAMHFYGLGSPYQPASQLP
ncbi:hypothetical protein [Mesorhizobium sp. WSM3224]|uniref:hypothetical protein n=1 Tax=Mesorhizobium sp. WSM3224 TaxID=1040986 RepID=UPI0012EB47A2|nr:hypothetical protein [Mesorhizobium sp. WSM3224]